MSYEGEQLKPTGLAAAADLTAKQFFGVIISAEKTVNLGTTNSACPMVLQNKPNTGEAAEVCALGVTKAVLGGTVAAGDLVALDSNAKFVLADSGKQAVGRCIVGGAADNIGTIMLGGVGETQ